MGYGLSDALVKKLAGVCAARYTILQFSIGCGKEKGRAPGRTRPLCLQVITLPDQILALAFFGQRGGHALQ